MSLKSLYIIATALADLDFSPPINWTSLLLERVHALHSQRVSRVAPRVVNSSGSSGSSSRKSHAVKDPGDASDMATFLWALSRLLRRPSTSSLAAEGSPREGPPQKWLRAHLRLLQVNVGPYN